MATNLIGLVIQIKYAAKDKVARTQLNIRK